MGRQAWETINSVNPRAQPCVEEVDPIDIRLEAGRGDDVIGQ